jgi:hypothetical protein
MLSSGLFALGYDHINVDEGWLKGRNAAGEMYEDLSKFPSGMAGLGQWVHSQGMKYGLYSCRGTCQCGTGTYNAPGSHGYEAADVDWMVAAGADYLKIDSSVAALSRFRRPPPAAASAASRPARLATPPRPSPLALSLPHQVLRRPDAQRRLFRLRQVPRRDERDGQARVVFAVRVGGVVRGWLAG